MSIVLHRPRVTGRHRLGRPGLIPLSALVTIRRRSFFTSWFRPGRHRYTGIPAVQNRPATTRAPKHDLELAAA
jgi:hypothetical protein